MAAKLNIESSDIELFFAKSNRNNNDYDNKKREYILEKIFNKDNEISEFNTEKWQHIKEKCEDLIINISKKYKITYSNYDIQKKAGRSNNHDFVLCYYDEKNTLVKTIKLEYKNSKSMSDYPQCLSLYTKNDFIDDISYHEFFYDNYLSKLTNDVIPKSQYLIECFKTKSDIKMFNDIRNQENNKDKKENKKKIVDESIEKYILSVFKKINKNRFLEKLCEQEDKLFIFYNYLTNTFSMDEIDINNKIEITNINYNKSEDKTKNINTIIIELSNNTCYKCLLRWKNHKGVLGPAWQIKYTKVL